MRPVFESEASLTDPTSRLAGAIQDLFDQVPKIQHRYRAARAKTHPDDALGLVDAWTEFHQALTNARYDPASRALLRAAPSPDAPETAAGLPERVMEIAAELSDAQVRLREAIRAAEASEPLAGPPDRGVLLARWRLLHRGEHQLRRAIARAMSALPAADHRLLRSLAPLGARYAAYLDAERTLARQWAAAARDWDPAAVAALDQWLSYTTDLRDRLDQLVAGYDEAEPLPAVAWPSAGAADPADPMDLAVPTPDVVGPPAAALGFRAALDALHDGYPELIAGCRRVLAALGGLGGQPGVGSLREALLIAWSRYDDALAGLGQRVTQLAQAAAVVDEPGLEAEFDHAAELRAGLADQLAEAEAWLARADPATDRPVSGPIRSRARR
ncbi:hypothetical protein OHA72_09880 [Dactylosporangium sp. NBC_01737]|uniref:hypothetical protein n=1 Tax=Dactylosporangium sp. NBC_01737 TaxID=2975959 RepID=UPI002E12C264|nr:hypothetical protein OHA72_09880 [Dactylosporangium sp. NBC_01737]